MNHHRVLGVTRRCTLTEARAAFWFCRSNADELHDGQYLSQVPLAYEQVMADIERQVFRRRRLRRAGRRLGVAAIVVLMLLLAYANWWLSSR